MACAVMMESDWPGRELTAPANATTASTHCVARPGAGHAEDVSRGGISRLSRLGAAGVWRVSVGRPRSVEVRGTRGAEDSTSNTWTRRGCKNVKRSTGSAEKCWHRYRETIFRRRYVLGNDVNKYLSPNNDHGPPLWETFGLFSPRMQRECRCSVYREPAQRNGKFAVMKAFCAKRRGKSVDLNSHFAPTYRAIDAGIMPFLHPAIRSQEHRTESR